MRKQANDNISYWGGCPTCGGNDGCMTDSARDHWYYCRTHRAKWCIGGNLFSNNHMSQQDFLANDYRLQHFDVVEPLAQINPEWLERQAYLRAEWQTFLRGLRGTS